MAVNMYDQAAEAPILNTYVPIDFDELYRIGVTQQQAINQAQEELQGVISTVGEFTSPSDIDVENYYKLSLGQLDDLIQEAAADPNKMKDPGYRARLMGRINGLDYAALGRLRAGADALRTRQSNVANMIANDTYYENWDRFRDLSNYDTLRQGILDEVAPTPYKSVFDLASPYVDDMKPTFFQGRSPITNMRMPYTNWMAITPEMRARELNAHLSDIIATPQGQMHLQEIAQAYPRASQEDVINIFMNQLMTVTSYKDIETPVTDEGSLRMALASLSGGAGETPNMITQRTDEIKSAASGQAVRWAGNIARTLANAGLVSTADPSRMSPEELEILNANTVSVLKQNGVPEEVKIPVSPAEYYQYDNASMMKLTNKDIETPEAWGDNANVQSYGFKNGDIVFTEDNKELRPISMTFFTDDPKAENKFVDITRILRNIKEDVAGWQPNNGANSFEYNDGEEYDVQNNVVKTEGRLYVTEEGLKDAIIRTYPEMEGWFNNNGVRKFINKMRDGFEENGQMYYRSMRESEDRLINGENTYVFDGVARNFGDVSSQSMNFNVNRTHGVVGTTTTADTWGQAVGSSFNR